MKKKLLIPLILGGVLILAMVVAILVISSGSKSSKLNRKIEITTDLSKLYDGTAVSLPEDGYTVEGDGAIRIDYRKVNSNSFTTDAPKDAGDYIVRVSASETNKWKAVSVYKQFTISKIKLSNIEVTSRTVGYNRTKVNVVALKEGIVEGDEVLAVLSTKQNWQDGSEFKLLLNDATGVKYELISLSGKQGDNYELVAIRGIVGTLKINNKTELTTIKDKEDYSVSFKTILTSDRQLTTIANDASNNLFDYLISDELKDKTLTISIFNSNEENKVELAKIKRSGTSFLGYSYTGGSLNNNSKTISFNLNSKVENYTDDTGYWIYSEKETSIYISIVAESFVATELTLTNEETSDRASSPYTTIYLANQPRYFRVTLNNDKQYAIETFTYSSVGDNKIKKNIGNIAIYTIDGTLVKNGNTNTLTFNNTSETTYYIIVTPYQNYNSNDAITIQLRWN